MQHVEGASTSGRPGPLAVYFPSGFQPGRDGSCSWEVHSNTARHNDHIVIARAGDVDFVGSSRSADAEGAPACKYAVGVLDKQTGVLSYAEVGSGSIVRMESRARGVNYGPTGTVTEQDGDIQARILQNKRLVQAFGSTRRKRQLEQKEGAKVGDDNVLAMDAVEDVLAAASDKAALEKMTKDDVLRTVTNIRHIPPHHPEATTASAAYRLEELVPEEAWDALEVSRLKRAMEDESYRDEVLRAKGIFPGVVLDRLALITAPEGPAAQRRLRAMAFLGPLISLYTGRYRLNVEAQKGGLKAVSARTRIQEDVLRGCLDRFYSRAKGEEEGVEVYSRTKEQARMLLLHVLVTALIAEDYSLGARQFEALRAALKLTPQDMVTHYRELGCTCEKAAGDAASPMKQYKVTLLPASAKQPPRTLADMFPKLQLARARAKK
ncbi:g3715 [Coccomyxa elongata]